MASDAKLTIEVPRPHPSINGPAIEPIFDDEGASRPLKEKYDLLQHRLGTGHFSEVRLALQRDTRQRVAVKVMRKTPQDAARAARFQSEVTILRMCARLGHPNLMQLLDVHETELELSLIHI